MSERWETVGVRRRVLAVTRTMTSLNRILDVLAVFADDVRVQIEFAVSRGSKFGAEVPSLLDDLGVRTIDWNQAIENEFDLIISASDHADLHQLRGPLMLLPHGAGFQKFSPHDPQELAGLTRAALWHEGTAVPDVLALSHESQRDLVPGLRDRTVVVGDPTLDLMSALAERREGLRADLGVLPGQKLITVTSTWGPRSLLARWPTLPAQLLAELPLDEFRVAAVLHPNVWAAHSSWQIHHWLRTSTSSGLILLPPTGPWPIGIAAADGIIGDHGSLSAYGAGLSIPLALGAFGAEEVAPGSAVSRLAAVVPRLQTSASLADQVRRTITEADVQTLTAATTDLFAYRGESLPILQRELYDVLGLVPLRRPVPRPLPTWKQRAVEIKAFHVETSQHDGAILVERFPAALAEFSRPRGSRHLIAQEGAGEVVLQNSSAIIASSPDDASVQNLLERYPGCRVVVSDRGADGFVLTERDKRQTAESATTTDAEVVAAIWLYLLTSDLRDSAEVVLARTRSRVRFSRPGPRDAP
ncbi:hypothetical protein ACFV9C_37995 [Kribbella sp. NPDC059898]|uniref:hypothetical protein n=1 Tax=Kribbella sp. NPDC059898 TaxID=3346995 RepID=UPI00364D7F54